MQTSGHGTSGSPRLAPAAGSLGGVRAIIMTGASRGLGEALLDHLGRLDVRVLALARSFGPRQHELAGAYPERVFLRPCDLSASDTLPDAAEAAAFLGDCAEPVLINNAATVAPLGAVGHLAGAELAAAAAVNLGGVMVLTNAFLGAVAEERLGVGAGPLALRPHIALARLLLVSSSAARTPKPGTAAYCAGKAGAEMFFDVVRAELAGIERIAVHTVDPGGMDTGMHAYIRDQVGVYLPDQARLREVAASGRLATPAVVAGHILAEYLPDPAGTGARAPTG